ncbi:MAG TPA: hypothetical protein VK612_01270 [Pyrinomonadaceae bacterium]|nr:hypothetical protein [Pyrinomonadaceae bacterium]
MLIKSAILEKIVSGEITVIFRRWKRASVKTGGTQMTQFGVLGIDAVDVIDEAVITAKDAKAAGFASRNELLDSLPDNELDLYHMLATLRQKT